MEEEKPPANPLNVLQVAQNTNRVEEEKVKHLMNEKRDLSVLGLCCLFRNGFSIRKGRMTT